MNRCRFAVPPGAVAVAVAALTLFTPEAAAQSVVNLIAAPLTKTVALPNGVSVEVPMWGFALDDGDGVLGPGETPTVPGPRLTVPASGSLTINLRNLLPEPVSIVIPGQQPAVVAPVRRADGRIVSMAPEAAPGGMASYTWNNLDDGTRLYHSGSHAAVQVPMGLYGAVTSDTAPGQAYNGVSNVSYDNEVLLLFSEIDVALLNAVNDGTYGDAAAGGPTSTMEYSPSLFLINGQSYTPGSPALAAGAVGQRTLLRLLNAGLRTHVVAIDNTSVSLRAEDGNPYADPRTQASVLLPAGKTHDAIWTPSAAQEYALYDRALHLTALQQPFGGMIARLRVEESGALAPSAVSADPDAYALSEDPPGPVGFGNVLSNDSGTNPLTAELYALPSAGELVLSPDGMFTYRPQENFSGVDAFWYRAVSGTDRSAPTPVTITVAPIQDAPKAFPLTLGLNSGETKPITLSGLDPDGDPLTFQVTALPETGSLSIVDPLTSGRRTLVAADLNTTSIPAGTVFYTSNGDGKTAFTFRAADGVGFSAPEDVSITVHAAETVADPGTPISLTVIGSDGAAIGAYYWTLEEDLTFDPRPGELDPNPLSINFHVSYMPVVSAGDETAPPSVDPTKKYFLSVLPKNGTHTNSGAPIARGQTSVNVTVNATPIPTGQLTVHVFVDNGSLNGVYNNVEPGLPGFAVMLEDTGGQKGHSAAHQITDAFSNPIGTTYKPCTDPAGCTSYEIDQLGKGYLLTDELGYATFKNLSPGLYEVFVIPPAGSKWVQGIQTFEGGLPIEAWVKANEPPFFAEFGPPGPHINIGFVEPTHNTSFLGAGDGPFSTITGQVTNMHMSRVPAFPLFSAAPFDFTRPYVALQVGGGEYGQVVYLQPTDEEGNFTIEGVPSGVYKLWLFDSAANFIPGAKRITVNAPAPLELGNVPIFQWFNRLYMYAFEDLDQDGFRDTGERGIPEVATNIRFRDGSIYQSYPTDVNGFVPYEQIFPFYNYLIAEIDYTRFKATGATAVVDDGGDTSVNTSWPEQVGAELDSRVLAPQPQSENGGAPWRTETGPVLLEAFQGLLGQSNVILWGKAPFAVPVPDPATGIVPTDVNVAPFDDFPGPGDTDLDPLNPAGPGNLKFDIDAYHGGLAGIVQYSTTRAENLARWGTAEMWEPGIAGVRVQLWDATRTKLLNEATTDSFDESKPTGCQWPGEPFTYLGTVTDCFDGIRNWNQVRPSVFDGGWAFFTQKEPFVDGDGNTVPIEQRTIERPLPAGKYVVKVIVPPGYEIVKEADKNVDFGEEYIPAEFLLTGYPLGDEGPPDPAARPRQDNDNLATPFCVGALHTVPDELTLFPGIPTTYAGDEIPLCDEKLITLRYGQDAAQPNFYLFTKAPVAGHVVGFILDDTAAEFDPNAPQFGERYAPPWLPVSIRDWTGRVINHTIADRNGYYNALVPSTFTSDRPAPSGYSPNLLQVCINEPFMDGPGGTLVPDPYHNKSYSQWCFPFQYMPGKTTYMDTPVVPTGAFAGQPGMTTVDAELPNMTPVVYSVTGPGNMGPYVVPEAADPATRTIVITSAGNVQVPNPEFDVVTTTIPRHITRDYGFGTLTGQVLLDTGTNTVALSILSWSNSVITVDVPVGTPTGHLRVIRCLQATCTATANQKHSVAGVMLTVATPESHAARPPRTVAAGGSIQAAIDAASPGDLILVAPGTYHELVIMDKPVRLQGWGAKSTIISAVKAPTEKLQSWRDRVKATLTAEVPVPPDLQDPDFDLDVNGPIVGGYLLGFQVDEYYASLLPNERPDGPPDPTEVPKFGDMMGDLRLELLAVLLGGEGAGVSVFGRYLPLGGVACPVTARTDDPATPDVDESRGFGLQNENGQLRPNARVDGFTITGSDSAAGIEVNGNACDIQLTNNHIVNNNGYDAAGIKVGHVGALASWADEPANNDRVAISYNLIGQNGSILMHPGRDYLGGGGITIGSGAPGYKVNHNFVVGNFTGGYGAGIAHVGLSSGGTIDHNTVIFNESYNQLVTRSGGGIYVGGRPAAAGEFIPNPVGDPRTLFPYPPNLPGPTPGSGHVTVSNNWIQGNQAASGDGGGISLAHVNGRDVAPGAVPFEFGGVPVDDPYMVFVWNTTENIIAAASPPWRVNVHGNTIVNNTAGLAGAGIALQDAVDVHIVHTTIAHNDSLAVAGEAFEPGATHPDPFISTPQPAGIASHGHTPPLLALLGAGATTFSNPEIVNSIVWQNRSFFFGPVPGGVQVPLDPTAPTYGLIPRPGSPYWDIAVLGGGAGATLAPTHSVLTTLDGIGGSDNVTTPPAFVSSYFNTNRRHAFSFFEVKTGLDTPPPFTAPVFDEGGNFIRPLFGPLTQFDPATGKLFGDYHLTDVVFGQLLYGAGGLYPTQGDVPKSLVVDADGDPRVPTPAVIPHRGADQVGVATPPPPPDNGVAGLVAAFGFEEVTGTTLFDSSAAGNSGSFNGTTAPMRTMAGRFGRALLFDGVNDLVRIADSDSLDVRRMTLAAWVKPSALDGWQTVVLKERALAQGGIAYGLYGNSDANGPSAYMFANGNIHNVTTPTALPLNEWHHLAVTYDGLLLRLYVDGVQVASYAHTGSIAASARALFIGGNTIFAGGEFFEGLIDEVQVYNKALTAAEIQALMKVPVVPGSPPHP